MDIGYSINDRICESMRNHSGGGGLRSVVLDLIRASIREDLKDLIILLIWDQIEERLWM